ncbi:uncharacterized protein ASPGLDRAFT_68595 [Aspergillus glaucus CBS 516.65]|uniref:UBL3-like ubiquitin domain-containing protein n=1 Tax=Aspergillus glaucus CBS 516.65 TaxID=1160497 RepID=A0A1L9VCU5_ASPGL|nr:hypothetical protein ASPGLDRAFT_68595 [Aspergillus glaucus CBS 516.65]OJJ81730.1 hypothetical protein ASPGLDRAFT_68595 [Aspergillus glaucus CBS 516.65]
MSANDNNNTNLPEPGVAPAGTGNGPLPTTTNESQPSSGPVETANNAASEQSPQQTTENAVTADTKPAEGGESAAPTASTTTNDTTVASSNDAAQTTAEKTKEPSPETAGTHPKEDEDSGPSLMITLLLTSGSRHPFKIDGKYLRKQSVNVENNDPFAMSVYTLKELIWREWRADWESRPSSPSSIRLISFGKLLEDKAPLSDSKFNRDAPNIVHMTIKPQELIDEEDAAGAKGQSIRERVPSVRSPGCRCVIL